MTRFLPAGAALLLAAAFAPPAAWAQAAPAPATQSQQVEREKKLEQARKNEKRRWKAIMEWIKKENPDQRSIFLRVHEPVLAGCKHDQPQNQRIAGQYQARADEMAKNPKTQATAELYARVAKLYASLAAENLKALKGGEEGKATPIEEALAAIPVIEERITSATGRPPRREWFLPSELTPPKRAQAPKPAAGNRQST